MLRIASPADAEPIGSCSFLVERYELWIKRRGTKRSVAALKVTIIAGARGARKTGVWRRRQNRDSDRMFIGWIARRRFTYNVIYMQPFPYGAILGEFELLVLLA